MKLYGYLTMLHRGLYESGLLESVSLNKKVISVGNLTFGGTGKTPFVKSLTKEIDHSAVIVRSYKGHATESALMDQEKAKHPEVWGDEACWYFENLSVPVYSGPKKWQSALLAAQNKEVKTLIVDDGFQHHKLKKDAELVLIDAVKGIEDLKYRARDHVSSLKKAAAVIITRSNLVSIDRLKEYLNFSGPIFLNETRIVKIRNFAEAGVKKVGLVSGIANPESFLILLKQKYPQIQFVEFRFPDHYQYSLNDLKKIAKENLDFVLTTEKDETKLKHLDFDFSRWGFVEVESVMQDPKGFKDFLNEYRT